jgi:hypothetical protein
MYIRTNRCYIERGSRANYVRSSIPQVFLLYDGFRGSLKVNLPGHEACHPSNAEVKSEWIYTSLPPTRLRGVDRVSLPGSSIDHYGLRCRTFCVGYLETLCRKLSVTDMIWMELVVAYSYHRHRYYIESCSKLRVKLIL